MKVNKLIIIFIFLLASCNIGITKEALIGQWNYKSFAYQNKSLNKPLANIAAQQPYIEFKEDGTAAIYSSGKVLSFGKYQLEGKIIRFVEDLPNNQTRKIPFLIIELNENQLIFQTMDAEVKVITAEKEK
jgi:hypothetical protein